MLEERSAFWAAVELHDRAAALAVVERLHVAGTSSGEIIDEIVVPTQARVGDLWLAGTVTISAEHAATSINESVVRWLAGRRTTPLRRDRPVLVACVDPEEHTLAPLAVAEHLLEAGVPTTYVPGSPTGVDLVAAVGRYGARAVLLSATLASSLAAQRETLVALGSVGVPVVVGGRAWGEDSHRAVRMGATAWAASVSDALDQLEALPERPAVSPPEPTAQELEADELMRFRFMISARMASRLFEVMAGTDSRLDAWWPDLESQLDQLVGCLASSLVTDDASILDEVRDWLATMIAARHGAPDVVTQVWEVFADTIAEWRPSVPSAAAALRVG